MPPSIVVASSRPRSELRRLFPAITDNRRCIAHGSSALAVSAQFLPPLARGLPPPCIRHLPFGIAGDLPMILNKKPYRFLAFLRSMTRSTSRSSKPSAFKALRIRYVLVTPCSAAAIDIARSR